MIELINIPVPVPFIVLLFAIVGFTAVVQHTPRAIIAAPPSSATFPPLTAVVCSIDDATEVVITIPGFVVKLISFP